MMVVEMHTWSPDWKRVSLILVILVVIMIIIVGIIYGGMRRV